MRQFVQKISQPSSEPGGALFARLRLNLTLWYTGVLSVALVVFGFALYFTVSNVLQQPIRAQLDEFAPNISRDWQRIPSRACLPPDGGRIDGRPAPDGTALYIACFAADGTQIGVRTNFGSLTDEPQGFPDTSLIAPALKDGTAERIIHNGNNSLYIVAYMVRDPNTGQPLGVIEIARSIAETENALAVLRTVLLLFGFVTLLLAALGGLFLSNRALAPTRLAFARQQSFVSNVSHELRTPLALLRADAEVLLQSRDQYPPEDAELLDDIVQETEHMTALTTTMLTLSRLDAGQAHLSPEALDLSEIGANLVRRVSSLAAAKGIALRDLSDGTVQVVADRQLVTQAILVLLDNALKYTPQGGSVTLCAENTDGHVRVVVSDTGIGVAPEHLPRLGERFYRTDAARNRDAGGAGLGLSLARSIATTHNGTLTFASTPGHGLNATLNLPT